MNVYTNMIDKMITWM